MKKHLIAAAVAGAFAVPAMAQVTVSGLLDVSAINNSSSKVQAGGGTAVTDLKATGTGNAASWNTSVLTFTATEDLGGGLRATAVMISQMQEGDASSGIGNRERTVALSGGFGSVRFGRFVPAAAVGFHVGGSATLPGTNYHLSTAGAAIAAGAAPANRMVAGNTRVTMERSSNTIQYTSPSMSGFTVNVNYRLVGTDTTASADKAQTTQSGLNLVYSAGPVTLNVGMQDLKTTTEAAAGAAAGTTEKGDLDYIFGSYNLGVAQVFASYAKRKDSTATNNGVRTNTADINLNSVGVQIPVGALALRASTYQGKDKRSAAVNTDDMKLTGHQVSAVYALSKRTEVIAALGEQAIKRDTAAALPTATSKVTANTITLTHRF